MLLQLLSADVGWSLLIQKTWVTNHTFGSGATLEKAGDACLAPTLEPSLYRSLSETKPSDLIITDDLPACGQILRAYYKSSKRTVRLKTVWKMFVYV